MTNEGSTEIVNFITPGTGALVLGLGNISHKVKTNFFFKVFFSTLGHDSDKPSA